MTKPWALISSFNSEIENAIGKILLARGVPCYSASNHPEGTAYYSIYILSESSDLDELSTGTKTVVVAPNSLKDAISKAGLLDIAKVYFYNIYEGSSPNNLSDDLANLILSDLFTYLSYGEHFVDDNMSIYLSSVQPKKFKKLKAPKVSLSISRPKLSVPRFPFSLPRLGSRKLKASLAGLLLVFAAPAIFMTLSWTGIFVGDKIATKNVEISKILLTGSRFFAGAAAKLPYNQDFEHSALLLREASDLGGKVLAASTSIDSVDYEKLYVDSSFLHANSQEIKEPLINSVLNLNLLDISRNRVLRIAKFRPYLDDLIGNTDERTYLAVIYDSDRHVGSIGKINKVYMFSVYNHKFVDFLEYTPDQVDQMIKGKVLPPSPLVDYFGIENFSIADAGWSGDFNEAAQKILKMADLAFNRPVNAVIALDKRLVEEGSFAESLSQVMNMNPEAVNILVNALDAHQAKVFMNNPKEESLVDSEDWSGKLNLGKYGLAIADTYSDDAERVTKDGKLNIDLQFDSVDYKLDLNLDLRNQDKKSKEYLRVFLPLESQVKSLSFNGRTYIPEISKKDNYKEVGFYVDFNGAESGEFKLDWSVYNDFQADKKGVFGLNIPALQDDPKSSLEVNLVAHNPVSLTNSSTRSYNTDLSTGIVDLIYWNYNETN